MRQFVYGNDAAFTHLENRAKRACVVFRGEEMPVGTLPPVARIGFEINTTDGRSHLFVQKGLVYTGRNQSVMDWFRDGVKTFASFLGLKSWLRDDLRSCYESVGEEVLHTGSREPDHPARPEDLTHLGAVHDAQATRHSIGALDEDKLFIEMKALVRGQDSALHSLCGRVVRHSARIAPRRPATFFAIGPTGVGKTRTAEILPQVVRKLDPRGAGFGFLRLDMSEYQERHRMSQLLGAPQGYVGYGDGAQLVDALIANPNTLVLFDEIEKAHPDILRTLMNALDAGRLSTSKSTGDGREIDCRTSIFYFTSNLDANAILKELEERNAFDNPSLVNEICRNHLRVAGMAPELIGRIGCFLAYRPLRPEARAEIVTLAVARVAAEYGLKVSWIEPSVIASILSASERNKFGARPDEYMVDELLGHTFAEAAASGQRRSVEVEGPPFGCRIGPGEQQQ